MLVLEEAGISFIQSLQNKFGQVVTLMILRRQLILARQQDWRHPDLEQRERLEVSELTALSERCGQDLH